MQSTIQDQHREHNASTADNVSRLPQRHELQVVHPLQKTYRSRYLSECMPLTGGVTCTSLLCDRLRNPYVTLKTTPNFQGKVRVDWLTIPNKMGQRHTMPYYLISRDVSSPRHQGVYIMYDVNADMNGIVRLYLSLYKPTLSELARNQPIPLFQPAMDLLHRSSVVNHQQMSPRQLVREFHLNKSQLAFTLCTRANDESFVVQWDTTVFSTVMTETRGILRNAATIFTFDYILPSSTNMDDGYKEELPASEDVMERRKRQKLDDTRIEDPIKLQSTTTATSMVNASLLILPVELVHNILDYFDAKTVLSLRRVCKQMYDLVNTYNRFKFIFKSTSSPLAIESIFQKISPENVVSLTIVDVNNTDQSTNEEQYPFYSLFHNLHFTRLRSMTFHGVPGEEVAHWAEHILNVDSLALLSIQWSELARQRTWPSVLSTFRQYHLRQLCINHVHNLTEHILWPDQWILEHLTINECTYREYVTLLLQLPHLRTFSTRQCIVSDADISAPSSINRNSVTAKLESLTVTHCLLSMPYLQMLLSLTPSVRRLQLASHRQMFDLFFNATHWENLIPAILPQLDKFEFIFFHTYDDEDNSIDVEALLASFRTPFWLDNERWLVAAAYALHENDIWLYTMPLRFVCVRDVVRLETSTMSGDTFRLTKRPLHKTIKSLSEQTPIILDLHANQISSLKRDYLINALHKNVRLVELNLGGHQIGNQGVKNLVNALRNNRALKILFLWENQIDDEGAQYLADLLRHNTELKELYLGNNSIGDHGVQHLTDALRNNGTLTTLDLRSNGIGKQGIQHLCDVLKTNQTLITLGLAYNEIDVQASQCLTDALASNKTLEHLYVDESSILINTSVSTCTPTQ
ncbi:unnamed protein product [Adineta ricciae]|uniref:F-box domain-containing protein n=1 Tax=Adineta ricciae TaxID=249248 RepID=A0A814ENW6_ADIRI|nr:unnamed protein product [Adineta ricciae]